MKLIYAADGAMLTPLTATTIRFVIMAAAAQLVLSFGSSPPPSPTTDEDASSQSSSSSDGRRFWLRAAELGAWGWTGTQLTSMGLQELPAVRTTLILATVNILCPLFAAIFGTSAAQRVVGLRTWAACGISLVSTVLAVCGDSVIGAPLTSLSVSSADGLLLGAAAAYAMCKVRLGTFVESLPAARLAAGRLQTQALFSLVLAAVSNLAGLVDLKALSSWALMLTPTQGLLLLGSALLPGVCATLLQAQGQKVVPAARAQPIFALLPLFSGLWAYLLLGEPISANEALGGVGICAGAALAASSGGEPAPAPPPAPPPLELRRGVVLPTSTRLRPQADDEDAAPAPVASGRLDGRQARGE